MKPCPIICLALLSFGCGWKPAQNSGRTLSVREVLESIHTLNGKTVRVTGYLPNCTIYDCGIFASEKAYRDFWRVVHDPSSHEKLPDLLSIGPDDKFDSDAGGLVGKYVVVTGQVSDHCRSWTGKPQCLDRASDIIPTSIELSLNSHGRRS